MLFRCDRLCIVSLSQANIKWYSPYAYIYFDWVCFLSTELLIKSAVNIWDGVILPSDRKLLGRIFFDQDQHNWISLNQDTLEPLVVLNLDLPFARYIFETGYLRRAATRVQRPGLVRSMIIGPIVSVYQDSVGCECADERKEIYSWIMIFCSALRLQLLAYEIAWTERTLR